MPRVLQCASVGDADESERERKCQVLPQKKHDPVAALHKAALKKINKDKSRPKSVLFR